MQLACFGVAQDLINRLPSCNEAHVRNDRNHPHQRPHQRPRLRQRHLNTSSRRPLTPDQKTPHRSSGRGWLHTRLSLPQARHTSLALHAESIPTPHLRHTLPTNLACLPACQPTTPWADNSINHCGSMHQILRLKDSPEVKGLWTGRTEYQNTRRSVPRRQPLTTAHICLPIHPTTQGKKKHSFSLHRPIGSFTYETQMPPLDNIYCS